MTVGVLVVITIGVCSAGLGAVVDGANPCSLLPPTPLLFHSPQSSQPVAVTSGCQKGGGSSHQSGGSGRSQGQTSSVGSGSGDVSLLESTSEGARSLTASEGDEIGATVLVEPTIGALGTGVYDGAVDVSTVSAAR
ncbi:hypothetical protein C7974DRAFT_224146 [Boeremia exigua]|uniref:uncharacterized protein n=1 Tax=Boeremia exigua TaxID=749465 RepID=UPI001E8DDFDB|nr:uncharacterized protein C7974DRAFT_224146 [Boeremia exigua]KAH6619981.1 hypothetical protein C7974DRAFT_224146 [Boeremia exigua]